MGWGCLYELERLEMELRYECWSVKGTTAASPLLAITHKHHLAASHQKEKTSHLHRSAKHMRTVWNCLRSKFCLGSFDATKFLKLHLFKFCFAEFSFLSNCLFFLIFIYYIDELFETFNLNSAYSAVGAFPNIRLCRTNLFFSPHPFFLLFSTFFPSVLGCSLPCARAWKLSERRLQEN